LTKHRFIAFLSSYYSARKKMGLDSGCGYRNWNEFYKCECIGFDLPLTLQNKKDQRPDICGTAHYLPFKDNSFDFLACYTTLPYISDVDSVLQEMYRVMRPKSVAVIIVQNPRGLALHEEQQYANRFDSKKLHKKLFSHGFKSIKHKNPKVFFYSAFYDLTSVYAFAIVEPIKKN